MFIKRLDKVHYDVWFGDGWLEGWSRVRRNHWGVSLVAGRRLNRDEIHQLNGRIL